MRNLVLHPIDTVVWWMNTPLTETTGMMYPVTSLFFLLLPTFIFLVFLLLSHKEPFHHDKH